MQHTGSFLTQARRTARLTLLAGTLIVAFVPSVASARLYLDDQPVIELLDARGNCGNPGSGAAFVPQTPASIVAKGGTLSGSSLPLGIEVAGVMVAEDGAPLDALGNRDNIGSGAVMVPQTPFSIFAHGGTLADPLTQGISVAGVQVGAEVVLPTFGDGCGA